MILEIDAKSLLPPYEQLRLQIAGLARGGAIPAGTRLPSIRQLANDLGLAGGTVARAYRELEAEGVVETRGRHGTVVRNGVGDPGGSGQTVARAAARFASEARRVGADFDQAVAALRAAFVMAAHR